MFTQFAPRLKTYLSRWLELRGNVRAFEDLVDLLQEQLIGIACQPLTGADLLQEKLISIACQPLTGSRSCADLLLQGQLIGSVSAELAAMSIKEGQPWRMSAAAEIAERYAAARGAERKKGAL